MLMRLNSLRNRFLVVSLTPIFILGAALIVYVRTYLHQNLISEYLNRTIATMEQYAAEHMDQILVHDALSISLWVPNFKQTSRDIKYIFIQDPEGTLLAHTFDKGFPSDLLGINNPPPGSRFSSIHLDTEWGTLVDVAIPLMGGGAGTMHVGLSEGVITGKVNKISEIIIMVILAGVILGTVMCILLANMTVGSITRLRKAVEAVGEGDLESRAPESGEEEIRVLGRAFNDMTGRLKKAMKEIEEVNAELEEEIADKGQTAEALKTSEEKLRAIWDNVGAGMVLIDPATHIIEDANSKAIEIMGLPIDQVVGRSCKGFLCSHHTDICPITDLGQTVANDECYLSPAGRGRLPILKTVARAKVHGTELLVESFVDIVKRKEAEEEMRKSISEKEVLIKEVHHRVKNNLQVISGLMNLQASFIQDQSARDYYRESESRVRTMALIHEELYRLKDLSNIRLRTFIHNLVQHLSRSYVAEPGRINIDTDIEDIRIVVDTALPCGLIVNELISNALKHGFPDERSGNIMVSFGRTFNGAFKLSVQDDGVGFPPGADYRKTKSLGMKLVTIMTDLLGGTVELDRNGGTRWDIIFPEYHEAGTVLF